MRMVNNKILKLNDHYLIGTTRSFRNRAPPPDPPSHLLPPHTQMRRRLLYGLSGQCRGQY